MSSAKKLQADVEKTMKKIEEGITAFDQTWEQVYEAESQTLREKYETELKKEIKKLQKLRDQVKSWVSKGEVRQKQPLIEARERIERRMEQFKECERESKTKAYSKEGLERGMPETPEQRKRREAFEYLQEAKEALHEEAEEMENEIEELSSKKKPDEEKLSELAEALGNHRFHVEKMELLERLLENEVVEPSDIDNIKDDIQYYLEAWREPDFFPDLDIYEPFELRDRQQNAKDEKSKASQEASASTTTTNADTSTDQTSAESEQPETTTAETQANNKVTDSKPGQPSEITTVSSEGEKQTESAAKSTTVRKATSGRDQNFEAEPENGSNNSLSYSQPSNRTTQVKSSNVPTNSSSETSANNASVASLFSPLKKANQQPSQQNSAGTRTVRQGESMAAVLKGAATRDRADSSQGSEGKPRANSSVPNDQNAIFAGGNENIGQPQGFPRSSRPPSADENGIVPGMVMDAPLSEPSGDSADRRLKFLQASLVTLPESRDSDRVKPYVPRNSAKTHPGFTTAPMPHLESPSLFEKLSPDTLFFIFYYQQGTYQQYLAAQQLKKQRWRFHKKYLTWFRRFQDPEVTTENYEQGAYVYFDHLSGWCSRIKQDFTFEYQYLEDDLPG